MSSDGWKILWFGVFCLTVIAVAWAATSCLSTPPEGAVAR
jgi:hypothetical protein